MVGIKIRKASASDLGSLEKVHIEIQEHHRSGKPSVFKELLSGPPLREHILSFIHGNGVATFLAEESANTVGFVQVKAETVPENLFQAEQRRGLINAIGVTPSLRRSRVGSLLMEAAESWIREQGLSQALLNVWAFNEPAIQFYKDRGYALQSTKMFRELDSNPKPLRF